MSSFFPAFSYLTHPIVLSAAVGAIVYHVTSPSENDSESKGVIDPVIASAASIAIAYYLLSGSENGFSASLYSMKSMGLN